MATTWADLPDDVPDLAAALDACAGLGTVNVEIKNWPGDVDFDASLAVVDAVVEVLAGPARYRACGRPRVVRSTSRRSTACASWHPTLATGWLVIGPGIGPDGAPVTADGGDAIADTIAAVADGGHRALHPHHAFVNPELVGAAHAAGVAVNTWTADDPDRIGWLADIGVDAVITNVPDVALTALGRRADGRDPRRWVPVREDEAWVPHAEPIASSSSGWNR